MKIVSWRGWEPEDDDLWIGLTDDVRGAWNPTIDTRQRNGNTSVIVGSNIEGRPIECEFGNEGTTPRSAEQTWMLGLQRLNPADMTPGELVVEFEDGRECFCQAVISVPGSVVDETVDTFDVVWYSTDNLWHDTTTEVETGVLTAPDIDNPSFATNTIGWTKSADPTNITAAFTRDASTYHGSEVGAGRLQVTANTAVVTGTIYVMYDTKFPCQPGDIVNAAGWVRTTNNWGFSEDGLAVDVVVRFFTAADAYISEHSDWLLAQDANIWSRNITSPPTLPNIAPATAAYCQVGVKVAIHPGQTGSVYFDDFGLPDAPQGAATPVTIGGNAPTHLKLTATPAGAFPQKIYARQFTIANNGKKVWKNQPFMVLLGDNSAASTTGAYWALLRDGRPQVCEIPDYDSEYAVMWMVVDYLPVGETATYTLLVSDQTVLPGVDWQFSRYTRPAFDTGVRYGTAAGGSHTTTATNTSGMGSEANRWRDGIILMLSGANAGQNRRITGSSGTQIAHVAFSGANSNNDRFIILMSHNGVLPAGEARWVYPVRQTERSESPSDPNTRGSTRGLWYIDAGQKRPSDYREDVPGSWHLNLYIDNNDRFSQKWATGFDPGGGNDYVAILDTNRSWEARPGVDTEFREQGGFDGVAIETAFPILGETLDYSLKNPNAMGRFVVGSRQQGGALGYTHEFEDSAALATLTNQSAQSLTNQPDTYELALHLIPNYGDEIGQAWAQATGTATGGTSTTLTDSNQEWITDQWIGGTVRIVSGTGAGQTVAITDSTATGITVASWPGGTPDSTSRYIIRNKSLVATVRNYQRLYLQLDMSGLTISAIGAETPAYVLYRDILISELDGLGNATERQRVAIEPEDTGRYIVLLADESLVIDGETMRAWVADNGSGDELRTVPPQAYLVYDVEADGTLRAAMHWLRVRPGDHEITLASDEPGIATTIDVEWTEAVYG
jgi:hypothetical protein